jgi:hypothetical protein
MSEPELAYMSANDDFDLPRWQTQAHHDTSTASVQSLLGSTAPATTTAPARNTHTRPASTTPHPPLRLPGSLAFLNL